MQKRILKKIKINKKLKKSQIELDAQQMSFLSQMKAILLPIAEILEVSLVEIKNQFLYPLIMFLKTVVNLKELQMQVEN